MSAAPTRDIPEPYHAGEFEEHLEQQDTVLRRMQILQLCAPAGASFSAEDIGPFCGVSRQAIQQIEKRALVKLGRALLRECPGLFDELK